MLFFATVSFAVILTHATSESVVGHQCKKMERPKTAEVPSDRRSWKIPHPGYRPVKWIIPCTESSCDPELPDDIAFNKKVNGYDRRRASTCGKKPTYKIGTDGYPMNPAGRTGVVGRGLLKHWGPNHMIKVALVRTDKDQSSVLLQQSKGRVRLPERFVNSMDDPWYDEETMEKIVDYLKKTTGPEKEVMKIITKAQKKSIKSVSGNMPSDMNTDNAWIEMHLRVVDCKKYKAYCNGVAQALAGENFKWTNANETDSFVKQAALQSDSSAEEPLDEEEEELYGIYCKARFDQKLVRFLKEYSLSAMLYGSGVGLVVAAAMTGGVFAIVFGGGAALFMITALAFLGVSLRQYYRC